MGGTRSRGGGRPQRRSVSLSRLRRAWAMVRGMVPVKPWKAEAVLRLLLSIFLCIYAGSVGVAALRFAQAARPGGGRFWLAATGAWLCLGAAFYLARRPWPRESLRRWFGALLIAFYAALILGAAAQRLAGGAGVSAAQMALAALSFQGLALVLVHFFLRAHELGWREAFGLDRRAGRAALSGAALAVLFLPVGWALQWSVGQLLLRLHFDVQQQEAVQTVQEASGWAPRTALGVITILLAPAAEETLFRGILYPWIKQLGFRRLALWGSSLLFAAVHGNAVAFAPLTLLALLLVRRYERTGNLLAPIAAHALFNALNFGLLLLLRT